MSSPFQISQEIHTSGGPTFAVRFTRPWHSYYPGDVASFPQHIARRLVANRRAQPVDLNTVEKDGAPPEDAQWGLRYPRDPAKARDED